MQEIHFSIYIQAPKEKVWNTMLEDATYREWTKVFCPGSYYEGNWNEGSEIRFFGEGEKGNSGADGMYSRIKENRLYAFVSIEHLGMIKGGVIDTTNDEVKKWLPSFENYSFKEVEGGTEVSVDMTTVEEYKAMFEESWPKALEVLKVICER